MESQEKQPNNKYEKLISLTLLFGPMVIMFLFILIQVSNPIQRSADIISGKTKIDEPKKSDILNTPKDNVELLARAAVVKNLRTGEVLYSKNENDKLPLASLTKLMTALVATESGDNNVVIQITDEDIATEGGSTLLVGERWSLRNLRDLTLVNSSNDGASAMANTIGAIIQPDIDTVSPKDIFVSKMNQKAEKIGMYSTFFYNESGLDENEGAGALGSANDIATLFDYILENNPDIIEPTKEDLIYINSLDGLQHPATNTNISVDELPNIIGSKTGFTEEAGGNLAVILDAGLNDPIVLVVLGSTVEGRFSDIKKLSEEFVTNNNKF